MTSDVDAAKLDRFAADLTAGGIVTRVLEAWAGGPVRAERVAGVAEASAQTRALLRADTGTPLGFRRVRLLSGDRLLSEADNWFVPSRLPSTMRDMLEGSDTPFGIVITPLSPRRETLTCERFAGDSILLVRALVLAGDGTPLALVEERYRRVILD
ncbi:hypothetical protein ACFSC3_01650 [Sphingomonas floccifaciens]|uniref:Chorismate lyase n=1 Tax=Sphingomonas floccifaciens TaxID=1844115 RepID=A0ABW4N8G4_9SPHN